MEHTEITIDTPARLQAAKLGMLVPRAIAHQIDLACLLAVAQLFRWTTGLGYARSDGLFLIGCALALGYFLVAEWRWGGTLGKRVVGISVVNREGLRISFMQALVRSGVRIIDASIGPLCLIGAASILMTKSSQRIGDLAADTYVIPNHLLGCVPRSEVDDHA